VAAVRRPMERPWARRWSWPGRGLAPPRSNRPPQGLAGPATRPRQGHAPPSGRPCRIREISSEASPTMSARGRPTQATRRAIRRPGLLSMRVSRLTSTRKRQLKKLPRQAKGRRIENLTLRVRLEWAGEDCRPGALTRRTDVRHPRRRVRARGLQHGRSVELQRRVWLIPSPSAVFRLMRHHARTPPAGPVAGGPRTRRWPRNWRD